MSVAAFDARRLVRLQRAAETSGYVISATGTEERIVYVVYRWGLQRELDSLDDVEAWLAQAGVAVPRP